MCMDGFVDLDQRDLAVLDLFSACLGGDLTSGRSPMKKIVVVGATALLLSASAIAYAQTSQTSQTSSPATPERLGAADRNTLTDLRIDLVKAALQLTPDQENTGQL
jgi:hypothetical protein